jgi:hypothetical protein
VQVEELLLEQIAQDGTRRLPFQLRRLGDFSSPKIADALNTLARDANAAAPVVEAAPTALLERAPTAASPPLSTSSTAAMTRSRPGTSSSAQATMSTDGGGSLCMRASR